MNGRVVTVEGEPRPKPHPEDQDTSFFILFKVSEPIFAYNLAHEWKW